MVKFAIGPIGSGGGGGGGGGGASATVLGEPEELWSGDLAAATADTYVFVTDDASARVIVPADADIAYVVIDHGSEDSGEPPVGTTHWVPISQFNALTAPRQLSAQQTRSPPRTSSVGPQRAASLAGTSPGA